MNDASFSKAVPGRQNGGRISCCNVPLKSTNIQAIVRDNSSLVRVCLGGETINETGPSLRAQIDASRWSTKTKNVKSTDSDKNFAEMEEGKTSKMAEKSLIASAENR